MLLLAAATPTPGWRQHYVEINYSGRIQRVRTARRKSVLGRAMTILGPSDGSVEIELYDTDQWLVSRRDEDLALGDNLAVLGGEMLQFGKATPVGKGLFRLAGLLRGREGTTPAIHAPGETFVLIERDALQPIIFPRGAAGSRVRASTVDGFAEAWIPEPGGRRR